MISSFSLNLDGTRQDPSYFLPVTVGVHSPDELMLAPETRVVAGFAIEAPRSDRSNDPRKKGSDPARALSARTALTARVCSRTLLSGLLWESLYCPGGRHNRYDSGNCL